MRRPGFVRRRRRPADVAGPPSAAATERLAGALTEQVDGLRSDLADTLALAMLLTAAGRADEASRVVESRREALRRFTARAETSLAAAMVEREAEDVLARTEYATAETWWLQRLRTAALATAVAAALAVAVVTVGDDPRDAQLIAGQGDATAGATAAPADDGAGATTSPAASRSGRGSAAQAGGLTGPPPPRVVHDVQASGQLEQSQQPGDDRAGILDRLTADARKLPGAVLRGADQLVGELRDEASTATRQYEGDADAPAPSEAQPPQEPSADSQPEQVATTAPSEEEPSAEEPPPAPPQPGDSGSTDPSPGPSGTGDGTLDDGAF